MKSMMTLILIVLVTVLAGCSTGQEAPLTDFDKVEILNGFHVIKVGEEYSVTLMVDEDVLDDVEAVRSGDTLTIRVKPSHDIGRASLRAEVTMPALTALTLQNGSQVTVSGSGGDVIFKISGGSHAVLDNFAVENANLTVSGGSYATVNVSGRLDAEVSGGSHVLYMGEPTIGNVDISGDSTFEEK